MGRGTRNQKRTGKGDAKTQGRTNKFGDVEDRFEQLNVENDPESNEDSDDSSSSEHEDQVIV